MIKTLFNSYFAKHSKFNYDFVGSIENNEDWLTLVNQYHKYYKNYKRQTKDDLIPKKIHQIWLGQKPLPKKYLKWMYLVQVQYQVYIKTFRPRILSLL